MQNILTPYNLSKKYFKTEYGAILGQIEYKEVKRMLIQEYEKIKSALMEIDVTSWKTRREILEKLRNKGIKIFDRKWYSFVEKHNLRYCDGLEDQFLAHSKIKGYKLTTDFELIRGSWRDFEKTAKNLLWKASRYKKAYAEHKNLSIEELEGYEEV